MNIHKNIVLHGSAGRPMLTDVFYETHKGKRPVVIYAHGFNGFKDWGNFDIIAKRFAEAGFVFVKFNFSHNGTSVDAPEDFNDLAAFAENNYSKQLNDLKTVIDWVTDPLVFFSSVVDVDKICLIGHSMGGGIAIIKANEDKRVKALATWAAIGECKTPWGKWSLEKLEQWKKDGVVYVTNSRTKQEMPLNYQLYQDYFSNEKRLNIAGTMQQLSIPVLICHGIKDESVPVQAAYELHAQLPSSQLFLLETDHVFGRKHPWSERLLPQPMQKVVDRTIQFFKSGRGFFS